MRPTEPADIETSSEGYAKRFSGEVGRWFLDLQEKATLNMLSDHANASVLDVGGGHGQLTAPLIRKGYDVTVLGSSDVCRNRIARYLDNNQCRFKTGDYLNLPFEDQSYDVVISFRLIAHVEEWPRLVSELTRVARKTVIIDYPSWRSINILTPLMFKLKKKVEQNTRTYLLYLEGQLVQEFKKHRFRKVQRYPQFCLPMALHRGVKRPQFSKLSESLCRLVGLTFLFGSPIILKMTR